MYAKVIAIVLMATSLAHSVEHRLLIDIGGLGGYDCDSTEADLSNTKIRNLVTGSVSQFVLMVRGHGSAGNNVEYVGAETEVPKGLTLEIGYWDETSRTCLYSPNLATLFRFHIVNTTQKMYYDSVWRVTGELPPDYLLKPELHMSFEVPQELVSQTICVTATWIDPRWGSLRSMPVGIGRAVPQPMLIHVTAPCSPSDIQRAKESYLFDSFITGNSAETLSRAEELIANGDTSASVFVYCLGAAKSQGMYERAIAYLDRCFSSYGLVPSVTGVSSDSAVYLRQRQSLEELESKADKN
ncbi:hypothetical protein HUU59_04645 [bacterium]|nr:hypothetical protein [bacterium]